MNKRTVVLKGDPTVNEEGRTAVSTILPGYLLTGHLTLVPQATSGPLIVSGEIPRQFALEREELGAGIDNAHQGASTISAFYASGDQVKVGVFAPGDQVTAWLASGQGITDNGNMTGSGGSAALIGRLRAAAVNELVVARALETVVATANANTAVRVEIV